MSWPKWLPANRVAAIAAFLTALAAGIGSLENAYPTSHDLIAACVSVIGAVVVALHFMLGSQKYDKMLSQERIQGANPGDTPAGIGKPPQQP